ncbi:hypothetical protein HMPREF0971_03359, partial [Segatella oris F0302]
YKFTIFLLFLTKEDEMNIKIIIFSLFVNLHHLYGNILRLACWKGMICRAMILPIAANGSDES